MADGLNTVPVLRMHLEELERVLTFVEGTLSARDLQRQYEQMGSLHKPSRLSTSVTSQLERVRGYMAMEDEDE
jgi:hypothetical protein